MRRILTMAALLMVTLVSLVARADDIAKPQPATIDAADKTALTAAMDTNVAVRGTIKKAEWSQSGKVMNIEFADSELIGAVFQKNKEAIDKAFDGDAAKKWTGAKVTVTGKLAKYGGKSKKLEGRPQIVISKAEQVKIEPAGGDEKK